MTMERSGSQTCSFMIGLALLTTLLTGCTFPSPLESGGPEERGEYVGRLEAVQVTSYMYGSHVLVTDRGRFAIERVEGTDVNLDDYVGRRVRVRAGRVEGYPVDGGPPLLAVRRIQSLD